MTCPEWMRLVEHVGLEQVHGVGGQKLLECVADFAHQRGSLGTWASSVVSTSRAGNSISIPE
jgi:hypothetical protein